MTSNNITATQIRLHKDKHIVSIVFNDGFSTQLAAELLRVESPSAEVQGHGAESKKIVRGKKDIKILPDGWTVVTKDRSLSAQWEHTILVTADGFEILTLREEEKALFN